MELALREERVALERTSFCGVGAVLHRISVRFGHVGSLSYFLVDNDVKFCSFTFTHTPLGLVRFVPGDRRLINKDVLVGVLNCVMGSDEAVTFFQLEPLDGSL